MRDYLSGYLDILPESQRSKIEDLIRTSNVMLNGQAVTEDEYAEIIRELSAQHQKLTTEVPQQNVVDPDLYNQFFANVQADLNLMFLESQLIDQAVDNYERLYDGILSDLNKEIQALKEQIDVLHLTAQGEAGLIVRNFNMTSSDNSETNYAAYSHLFRDRDGTSVAPTVVQTDRDRGYLSLNTISSLDHLHDAYGNPSASIALIDQRGVPITQTQYPITNAIDNSTSTYWGEVVLVDQPISVALDDVPAGGAMTKFTITFPQQRRVSQVSLTPFTNYPLKLASLKYEEDIETYHVPKELITSSMQPSTGTMSLTFPEVIARRLTFILVQANWTQDTYLVRQSELGRADIWDQISRLEEQVTLQTPNANPTVAQSQVDQITGWDIYLQQLAKYQQDLATYNTRLAAYNAWKAQADAYSITYNNYVQQVAGLNRMYGTTYVAESSALG